MDQYSPRTLHDSVYLLHSEFYYGDAGFSYGYALTPFYVNTFFLLAATCFSKKYMKVPETICFQKRNIIS